MEDERGHVNLGISGKIIVAYQPHSSLGLHAVCKYYTIQICKLQATKDWSLGSHPQTTFRQAGKKWSGNETRMRRYVLTTMTRPSAVITDTVPTQGQEGAVKEMK